MARQIFVVRWKRTVAAQKHSELRLLYFTSIQTDEHCRSCDNRGVGSAFIFENGGAENDLRLKAFELWPQLGLCQSFDVRLAISENALTDPNERGDRSDTVRDHHAEVPHEKRTRERRHCGREPFCRSSHS